MIRSVVGNKVLRGERFFRWRGGDVSRVEALTDAIIALSLTLVIVSLEVPDSFDGLIESFKQLPAFAVSFGMLVLIWFYHYQYHRRFGLENLTTIVLNAALLFLILFYVYPLKFLFTELFNGILYGKSPRVRGEGELMLLYSGGVCGIFGLFAVMNYHAYRLRKELKLNPAEVQVVIGSIYEQLVYVGIGIASMICAVFISPPVGGLIYFLIGPIQFAVGFSNGRKIERLAKECPEFA